MTIRIPTTLILKNKHLTDHISESIIYLLKLKKFCLFYQYLKTIFCFLSNVNLYLRFKKNNKNKYTLKHILAISKKFLSIL